MSHGGVEANMRDINLLLSSLEFPGTQAGSREISAW